MILAFAARIGWKALERVKMRIVVPVRLPGKLPV